ncbi:MAG: ROK family protein, partial [Anaerovorax sp.]
MKKNIVYVVILLILGAVFFIPGLKDKLQETLFPIAAIEKAVHISPEDYDIDLKGINTASTNLKNFKDKPMFLNFWGTWCPPCRKEWPSIQKLYNGRKGHVNFVLIAMNDEEDAFGHMIVNTGGEECRCGNYGCIESYSSVNSITRKVNIEMKKG